MARNKRTDSKRNSPRSSHHKQSQHRSAKSRPKLEKEPRSAQRTNQDDEPRADRLEGIHAVEEALKAEQAIDKIWVMQGNDGTLSPHLAMLARQAKQAGAVIVEAPRQTLDRLSQTGTHQGIIAQMPAITYVEPEAMIARAKEKNEAPFLILLDQIQDSHNLGAVLRVADSVGAHGVIIPKHRALGVDAIAMRASAGAAHHVPVARVTNLAQCMRELKQHDIWIAGTDATGENALMSQALRGPIALVIGNEGEGMSQLVRETCDFVVSIPMMGHVSSLNASVACGILAYRVRQLRDAQDGNK